MKIAAIECLHADAGHRNFDFLKITTDDGLVGWSEYNESFGGKGVTSVIENLVPHVIGRDPAPMRRSSPICSRSAARRSAA
jgi:galactonate dehydratase